jgi:hypothetical protein
MSMGVSCRKESLDWVAVVDHGHGIEQKLYSMRVDELC